MKSIDLFSGPEYVEQTEQKDQQQNIYTVDLPPEPILKPWCNFCNQEVESMIVEEGNLVCSCHGCTETIPIKYEDLIHHINGIKCRLLAFLQEDHIHFDNDDFWFVDINGRELQYYNAQKQPEEPKLLPWLRKHKSILLNYKVLIIEFIVAATLLLRLYHRLVK
jgi:hypothetical protein